MDEFFSRALQLFPDRIGKVSLLRFLVQPIVVAIPAVTAGLKDSRKGSPPFDWSLFTEPSQRSDRLIAGAKDLEKIFLASLFIDCLYQLLQLRWLYPLQLLLVTTSLAVVPYIMLRSLMNRMAQRSLAIKGRHREPTRPLPNRFASKIEAKNTKTVNANDVVALRPSSDAMVRNHRQ